MTAGRFLAVFAATNTLAVAALSVFLAGGVVGIALGLVLLLLALVAFAVTARIVVLARPVRRSERSKLRRLTRDARKDVR